MILSERLVETRRGVGAPRPGGVRRSGGSAIRVVAVRRQIVISKRTGVRSIRRMWSAGTSIEPPIPPWRRCRLILQPRPSRMLHMAGLAGIAIQAAGCAGLPKPARMSSMKPSEALAAHRDKLLAIAAGHGASNLRVFGSVAKGVDREGSDIDLLVDVRQGTSLFDLVGLQQDLEDALGLKVDLLTEPELHPMIRDRILAEARAL